MERAERTGTKTATSTRPTVELASQSQVLVALFDQQVELLTEAVHHPQSAVATQ